MAYEKLENPHWHASKKPAASTVLPLILGGKRMCPFETYFVKTTLRRNIIMI
jgi:hypothetical protein